jgi:type III polyketide synthase
MGRAARILCVALDVNTTIVRSELDSVHELQEARIGACLFSDCASAVVLSNGVGEPTNPVYELLRWNQKMIPDTENDYGFDVHETGWKPRLSHRLPNILNQALRPAFKDLIGMPQLHGDQPHPASFDWAMDPFGGPVLASAEDALDITAEHLRASYDTYKKHGHSGSAALFSVLDRLRSKDMDAIPAHGKRRDYIIGCSFGPGIVLDMCMLRKYRSGAPQLQSRTGSETSATSTSEGYSESPASGTHMHDALKSLDLDHMK